MRHRRVGRHELRHELAKRDVGRDRLGRAKLPFGELEHLARDVAASPAVPISLGCAGQPPDWIEIDLRAADRATSEPGDPQHQLAKRIRLDAGQCSHRAVGVAEVAKVRLPHQSQLGVGDGIVGRPVERNRRHARSQSADAHGSARHRGPPKQAERVVVVEDERLAVDQYLPVVLPQLVVGHVPRGETAARVPQCMHTREELREIVEVLLVAELTVLPTEVTPLDAALVPPVQRRKSVGITSEREPFDVERSARRLLVPVLGCVAMRDDQNRIVAEFVEERLWIGEEPQVGIQVGHRFDAGLGLEQVTTDSRGRGPAVLDLRPIALRPEQRGIMSLELRERNDRRRPQVEPPQEQSRPRHPCRRSRVGRRDRSARAIWQVQARGGGS